MTQASDNAADPQGRLLSAADLPEGTILPPWLHSYSPDDILHYAKAVGAPPEYHQGRLLCPPAMLRHYSAVRGSFPGRPRDGNLHVKETMDLMKATFAGEMLTFQTTVTRNYLHRGFPHLEFFTTVADQTGYICARMASTYRWIQ